MLVLVLDTSLKGPLLALADANIAQLLQVEVRQNPQEAAAHLPALIAGMLQRQKLSWEQVEGVIVGTGPGSFTGIKIALSFVYGLHRARPNIGLYACSALASLGRMSRQDVDLWVLPATSTQGYYANSIQHGVLNLEQGFWCEPSLKSAARRVMVLGTWERLKGMELAKNLSLSNCYPSDVGQEVLTSMLQDFIANSRQLSDGLPRPEYLRKSAPEEKAELSLRLSKITTDS